MFLILNKDMTLHTA